MSDELGLDLACVDDIDPGLSLSDGRQGLIEAIARRLITPRGGLFYDPTYGYDVRRFVGATGASAPAIAQGVANEALQDERILQARAAVTLGAEELTIRLSLQDAAGPFELTLAVSRVTVSLLRS